MESFKTIEPLELNTKNVFDLISNRWMLITAGTKDSLNTMTASWGCLGHLWHKNITVCFVRKERHTFKFLEKNDYYSLSFYPEKYKKVLTYCGTHSGKEVDKVKETNLTPIFEEEAPYFEEANLIFICRKIYTDDIREEKILDPEVINSFYTSDGTHKIYVGEIVKTLIK